MLETIFEFQFLHRGLLVGLIVGFICPLIGVFIVARRLSVIGEALSHMSLSGIAIGSMLGSFVPFLQSGGPAFYSMIFAVIGAFIVEWLRKVYSNFSEIAIPILLSFGMGLGVVIFSSMDGLNVDFAGYLFGNLLAVSKFDLLLTIIIGIIVLASMGLFYKKILVVTFDPDFSKVLGIRKNAIDFLFIIILALTISVTVRAVGVMLVSGLLILPPAAGMLIGSSFKKTLFIAIIIGELSIILGLFISYYFSLASGGTIIMIGLFFLLSILLVKKIFSLRIT